MNRKLKTTLSAFMSVFCAFAAQYTLDEGVSGAFDWTVGDNYAGGAAPGSGDVVCVPNGVTVVISNSMATASLERINSLGRIRPMGNDATVVFAVADGETLDISCPVNFDGDKSTVGRIVKTGGGELRLNSLANNGTCEYRVTIDVQEGVIRCKQDLAVEAAIQISNLNVASNAVFYPYSPGTVTIYGSLTGGGLITNTAPYSTYKDYRQFTCLGATQEPSVFSGTIDGLYALVIRGNQYFTGERNKTATVSLGNHVSAPYTGAGCSNSTIGVRLFGRQGDYDVAKRYPSSAGYHQFVFYAYGGRVVNLGTEPQTTDKKFVTQPPNSSANLIEFDGGAYGGVTFTGDWIMHATAPNVRRIYLTGENTENPCIISNKLVCYGADAASFTFVKQGAGVWRFADTANMATDRTTAGLVAVQDGTLEITSLAGKGEICSIGTSAAPYPSSYYETATDTSKMAPYAIELGGGSTTGRLVHVGASDAICTNRPVAMTGAGVLASGSSARLEFGGIRTVGSAARTLILAGDGASLEANTLSDVRDMTDGEVANTATLSLEKAGTRKWIVTGRNDIHGAIRVREGELELRNAYSWYKWIIKRSHVNTNDFGMTASHAITLSPAEFGLYDADGNRLNRSLAVINYPGQARDMAAGTAAYGYKGTNMNGMASVDDWRPRQDISLLSNIFDGKTTQIGIWYYYRNYLDDEKSPAEINANIAVRFWNENEESHWLPIVMHLADSPKTVAGYDVLSSSSYYNPSNPNNYGWANNPKIWSIQASIDGVAWDELESDFTSAVPTAANVWMAAAETRTYKSGDNDAVHTNAAGVVDMRTFPKIRPFEDAEFFPNVSEIQVDAGAKLTIRANMTIDRLTVDSAGAGMIDGGTFAPSGVINIVGDDAKICYEVPITFLNVAGVENLAGWSVTANGGRVKRSVTVDDGKISFAPPGIHLIFK